MVAKEKDPDGERNGRLSSMTGKADISIHGPMAFQGAGRQIGTFMGIKMAHLQESISAPGYLDGQSASGDGEDEGLDQQISKFVVVPQRAFLRSKVSVANYLCWSKAKLSSPMTDLDRSLGKTALRCFRDLQRVMGDRKYARASKQSSPDARTLSHETIRRLASIGVQNVAIRNELYVQAFKQVTANPQLASAARGWEVLCVYVSTFSPLKDFTPLLTKAVSRHAAHMGEDAAALYDQCESSDPAVIEGRIGLMARFVVSKLQRFSRSGPCGYSATLEIVEHAIALPFKHLVFGVSLEQLMQYPENRDESGRFPRILTFLSESIIRLHGCSTQGIFRVPALTEDIQVLRLRIEQGEYEIDGISDPLTPASLLKLWMRELDEPIVPHQYYLRCIACGGNAQSAIEILEDLPELNRNVLDYLIKLLQVMSEARYQIRTKMSVSNLSMVFAPNVLRCPSQDPLVIMANSKFEQNFVQTLINYLDYD